MIRFDRARVDLLFAQFTERYPAIKAGKGSLSFRLSDELPLEAIGKVIRRAMEPPDATGG